VSIVAAGLTAMRSAGRRAPAHRRCRASAGQPALTEEVFGPSSLVIRARSTDEIAALLEALEGQLTATLHLDDADHALAAPLIPVLERKVGRILANGWPTGVEVSRTMVHGGPFPATSDGRPLRLAPWRSTASCARSATRPCPTLLPRCRPPTRWACRARLLPDPARLPAPLLAGASFHARTMAYGRGMTFTDIARRTYDHNFRLDPIVRSLLDTDFYKLLMLQMIRHVHPDVATTFSLINRTTSVRLADVIDERTARAARSRAHRALYQERADLAGRQQLLWPPADVRPRFLAWLADFRLPEYELRRHDGQ
jgi:hypothetical protein